MGKRSRGELAGRLMGRALVEMVNLFYQNTTARRFLYGLTMVLHKESQKRGVLQPGKDIEQ